VEATASAPVPGWTCPASCVRFSLVSGGVCCVGGVVAVCALLPALVRYRADELPGVVLAEDLG
jgi:hypothetical protein